MGPLGTSNGSFDIPYTPTAVTLRCVVSNKAGGWEHVSISARKKTRTPNWAEMEFACRQFWDEEEAVMQWHPPRSEWINNVPNVLHLWKPVNLEIPRPPSWLVGSPALNGLKEKPGSPEWNAIARAEQDRVAAQLEADGILPSI